MKYKYKYSKDQLEEAVNNSTSWRQVFEFLGFKNPANGNLYRTYPNRCVELGIDTSHFKGQSWAKGLTQETSDVVRSTTNKIKFSDDEVFKVNSPVINGTRLRKRLIALGRKYECALCCLSEWKGEPIALHVDHINGVHNDNRLDNLRFLCPNCHQQTDTWGSKNVRRDNVVE